MRPDVTELPDDLAALFAATTSDGRGWLRRVLEVEFRRGGARLPRAVDLWLADLEAERRAVRISQGCTTTFRRTHPVTVNEYAALVGTSPQAVRAKCRRGTLDAELVGGAWLIYPREDNL